MNSRFFHIFNVVLYAVVLLIEKFKACWERVRTILDMLRMLSMIFADVICGYSFHTALMRSIGKCHI